MSVADEEVPSEDSKRSSKPNEPSISELLLLIGLQD